MPSATLRPAGTGHWAGWRDLTGAASAWEATDESPHDSDASFFRLGPLGTLPNQAGRVSVLLSQMGLSRLTPAAVTLTMYARATGIIGAPGTNNLFGMGWTRMVGAEPETQLGATTFEIGGSYAAHSLAYTLNPFTAAPWERGDLVGLQPYVQTVSFPRPTQFMRFTGWDVFIVYDDPTYWENRG